MDPSPLNFLAPNWLEFQCNNSGTSDAHMLKWMPPMRLNTKNGMILNFTLNRCRVLGKNCQVEIGANQTRSGWFKLNLWQAELIGSVLT